MPVDCDLEVPYMFSYLSAMFICVGNLLQWTRLFKYSYSGLFMFYVSVWMNRTNNRMFP